MRHRTGGSKVRVPAAIGAVLLASALIASCSNSTSPSTTTKPSSGSSSTASTATGSAAPGVTPTQVSVGSIASLTGAISADFASFVPGIQAYLNTVNAQGGVGGRKIVLTANLDDAGTSFNQLSHTLIQQDNVFAAFISTFFFTPGLFVQTKTPTFGYNTSGNWTPDPNLFGAGGSTQDYNYGAQSIAYLMKQLGAKSAAVMSYGPAITSSYDACHTSAQKLQQAGINVAYTNLDESLGGDYTPAVQRMQQSGVDFVFTCMQSSDNITLARAIKQYGLNVHQLWFSGYDNALLSQYSNLMQGVYLNLNGNVPFQVATAYPGKYPGMDQYLAAMNKYSPANTYSLLALQGWESAALLVQGIRMAGNNLTQANVINQINTLTAFTAGGVSSTVDWTKLHTNTLTSFPGCSAFVKVAGTKFVPAVAKAPQTIVCFAKDVNLKNPVLATPPAGTPGT
ncbi:MAG TPA: ABC transporter substrate-binding protein [Acidimicrobiales bacterium]|jgi:branched-chain amino acid transport system substrate-binding protein|nr:ABC transporter substrate-binding protein [Acidimicrobiales bacterium]